MQNFAVAQATGPNSVKHKRSVTYANKVLKAYVYIP